MPLFDFVCDRCQHRFEELVSADEVPPCPDCKSAKVSRQLPVFAVGGASSGKAPLPDSCGSCEDPRGPGCPMMN